VLRGHWQLPGTPKLLAIPERWDENRRGEPILHLGAPGLIRHNLHANKCCSKTALITGTKCEEPSGFRGSALHASRAQTSMPDWLPGKRNKAAAVTWRRVAATFFPLEVKSLQSLLTASSEVIFDCNSYTCIEYAMKTNSLLYSNKSQRLREYSCLIKPIHIKVKERSSNLPSLLRQSHPPQPLLRSSMPF
jgi:hypothetical protein